MDELKELDAGYYFKNPIDENNFHLDIICNQDNCKTEFH